MVLNCCKAILFSQEKFLSGNLTESQVILKIIDLLPNSTAILIVLVLCMIMLYVSTLDYLYKIDIPYSVITDIYHL